MPKLLCRERVALAAVELDAMHAPSARAFPQAISRDLPRAELSLARGVAPRPPEHVRAHADLVCAAADWTALEDVEAPGTCEGVGRQGCYVDGVPDTIDAAQLAIVREDAAVG